jgi:uncharacterized Zn finger protein (UPF0148 family)
MGFETNPGDKFAHIACDNCGEPLGSFDPLESHTWCDMCKMRAAQISENARRELKIFGEMRRKVRESNNGIKVS